MCHSLVEGKAADVLILKLDFQFSAISSEVYFKEYLILTSRLTTKINVLLCLKISYFTSVLLVIHVTLSKFSLKFLTCISSRF